MREKMIKNIFKTKINQVTGGVCRIEFLNGDMLHDYDNYNNEVLCLAWCNQHRAQFYVVANINDTLELLIGVQYGIYNSRPCGYQFL